MTINILVSCDHAAVSATGGSPASGNDTWKRKYVRSTIRSELTERRAVRVQSTETEENSLLNVL